MRRYLLAMIAAALLPANAFPQSQLAIDKFDRKSINQAAKEVGFSTLLEGTVGDPELSVFVLVSQPHIQDWRVFPAAVDRTAEGAGRYRWRAVCNLGELDGAGKGDNFQLRAIALDPRLLSSGLPERLPPATAKSSTIVLKRVK